MSKVDLSVIILNFNTSELLDGALSSLEKIDKDNFNFEVIVADNGSKDGSIEMVKKKHPKVILVDNKANLGFAAGNNRAVPKSRGRLVLFLNSDTIVPKETLPFMVDYMDRNLGVGISTCKLVLASGELDPDCHRGFPTPWNSLCYFSGLSKLFPKSVLFNSYHMGHSDMTKTHQIDACVGAFLLTRREVGEKVGWWDEDYFFYGEDLEFCYRVKNLGLKIMYVPQVFITHLKGASSGLRRETAKITRVSPEVRRKVAKASIDAMKIFYQKHYEDKYPKILKWLIFVILGIKYQLRLRGIK